MLKSSRKVSYWRQPSFILPRSKDGASTCKKTREIPVTRGKQGRRFLNSYAELDRRLIRLEAKFALIEHVGGAARRALPEPKQE